MNTDSLPAGSQVLLVDDDPVNLYFLASLLEEHGFHSQTAERGLQALELALSHPPDLVLLDIRLPDMDGLEVCHRLKADPRTGNPPVIFLSSARDVALKVKGFQAGGVDYITKPFQPEEVLVRIGTHLSLRLAHRQLEESRALLEERVKERTAELEKANQAKSDFLATMSHEIRTPMHAILGMSDILLETRLDDSQRSYVTMFQKAGRNLLNLINDILDLSKVESGQLGLQEHPFDLANAFSEVVDILAPQAHGKGVLLQTTFPAQLPHHVVGDAMRFKQILLNLLGNAIKFTEKGAIQLTARLLERQGDRLLLEFTVEDSGCGIPADQLAAIFKPFTQVDSSSARPYGGAGLGLSICHRLVESMGGTMAVSSTLGVGSRFEFTLLLKESSLSQSSQPSAPQWMPGQLICNGLNILLAEDSEDNVQLISIYLKATPHRLTVAKNGREAVEMYRQHPFDLILMDLQMPIMDGYTATRTIRQIEAQEKRPRLPILAISAFALHGDEEKSLQAGCDQHITKPLSKQHLLHLLNTWQ
ncbi:MAG: response regulator [Magnetococcales bacterium]|nr:response regulator [Magnetococcales bacterium]